MLVSFCFGGNSRTRAHTLSGICCAGTHDAGLKQEEDGGKKKAQGLIRGGVHDQRKLRGVTAALHSFWTIQAILVCRLVFFANRVFEFCCQLSLFGWPCAVSRRWCWLVTFFPGKLGKFRKRVKKSICRKCKMSDALPGWSK